MSTATDQLVDFKADQMGMFAANSQSITANQEKAGIGVNANADLLQKVEFADADLLKGMDQLQQNPPGPEDSLGFSMACRSAEDMLHGPQRPGPEMAPDMQLRIQPPTPVGPQPFGL